MSFTAEIKSEIAENELKECCARAELSGIVQLTSSLSIVNRQIHLLVRSENEETIERAIELLKQLYNAKTEILVAKKTNLKKNNVYTVEVLSDATKILEDLGLYSQKGILKHPGYSIVLKECDARAYLAGCFLAYGSCNAPEKTSYHLEIATSDEEHANFIVKQISRFIEGAKIAKRRNKYIVYLKKADLISDFLRMIGSPSSLMKFEDVRIERDLRNSGIRLDNCAIANDVKSMTAGKKQNDAIDKIIESGKYESQPEKIRNVIDIRKENPEDSLLKLCDKYQKKYGENISKSGMKHRLNKIEEIAERL